MRPDGIVMPAPALDDDLRLAESVEDLAVEQAARCTLPSQCRHSVGCRMNGLKKIRG